MTPAASHPSQVPTLLANELHLSARLKLLLINHSELLLAWLHPV